MGITDLLKELPGGNAKTCTRYGFADITILRSFPASVDTGTLLFVCAFRHKDAFDAGDYIPAAREFQRQIISMNLLYKWEYTLVFDGIPPKEKRHEHRRRQSKQGSLTMTAKFISICILICKRHFVKFVVAPAEADMQVGRTADGGIPVCRDSDDIAFGNFTVVIVDSWPKEQYRLVDLRTPLAEGMKDTLPVYHYFHLYGWKVIHWFAAIMGCDVSVERSGISGMGRTAFVQALSKSEDKGVQKLQPRPFAKKLRDFCRPSCRLSHSIKSISTKLQRVARWFTEDGTYYDNAANLYLVSGSLLTKATLAKRRHMLGDVNPKTGAEYSVAAKKIIDAASPHNLLQNSAARRSGIKGVSLPSGRETIASCRVEELKGMVIARGGSVTGRNGKALRREELQQIMRAYMSMEMENSKSVVYFNREKDKNGIFSKIDTGERQSIPQIIDQLLRCGEFEESLKDFLLRLLACSTLVVLWTITPPLLSRLRRCRSLLYTSLLFMLEKVPPKKTLRLRLPRCWRWTRFCIMLMHGQRTASPFTFFQSRERHRSVTRGRATLLLLERNRS